MHLRTCVAPPGRFVYGIHKPSYPVQNLRTKESVGPLGIIDNRDFVENSRNFPVKSFHVEDGESVYQIPNPLPFRGSTFILKSWADKSAQNVNGILLAQPEKTSFFETLQNVCGHLDRDQLDAYFTSLPDSVLLALATTSTDPVDLVKLAEHCCDIVHGTRTGLAAGLKFKEDSQGRIRAVIHNYPLFEALANNPHLPDDYKLAMVLRAGVQGSSEIVGDYHNGQGKTHVFEYLRRNSYIPWGHYASNMAEDAIRYSTRDLSSADMDGLRHLYYQRTFVRLAEDLDLPLPPERQSLSSEDLEKLRLEIIAALGQANPKNIPFNSTLWGWNYGFDFAPTHYRLHASHQQIHTQYAMLPGTMTALDSHGNELDEALPTYGCGDLVAETVDQYRTGHNRSFFDDYLEAIRTNQRTDGNTSGEQSLIVYEDEHVMLFVPKAQTSQWELQLITNMPVGNIVEADTATRASLDHALLLAQKILDAMGVRMVTSIEFSKRINSLENDQRLLYSLLPKLPESPGAFSEAQFRWINGHYPEDFAQKCRSHLEKM